MTPHPDLTVPLDDMLVERFPHCMLCAQPAKWMDIRIVHGLARFASLCARCHQAHGWRAVDAVLALRAGDKPTTC